MPDRIHLRRTKDWRKPEGAVIVSRPSIWGNPWKPGAPGTFWLRDWPLTGAWLGCALDADGAVALYDWQLRGGCAPTVAQLPALLNPAGRKDVRQMIRNHFTRIHAELNTLRGRDLCCWCPLDAPCHADVLLEVANG